MPELASVMALLPHLGVSGHWLLTGEGPMHPPDGTEAIRLEIIGRIADGGNLTPEAVDHLRQGSPEDVARAIASMIATSRASGQ